MVANPKIKRSYLFFPDKEKEGDGYKPDAKLRLRVRWSGRKVDFNVGYRIKLSQWDTQTQRCRVKTTNLQKQSASLITYTGSDKGKIQSSGRPYKQYRSTNGQNAVRLFR